MSDTMETNMKKTLILGMDLQLEISTLKANTESESESMNDGGNL